MSDGRTNNLEKVTQLAEGGDGGEVAKYLNGMSLEQRLNTLSDMDIVNAQRRESLRGRGVLPDLNVVVSFTGQETATIALQNIRPDSRVGQGETIYSERVNFKTGEAESNYTVVFRSRFNLQNGDTVEGVNKWYQRHRTMQSDLRRSVLQDRTIPRYPPTTTTPPAYDPRTAPTTRTPDSVQPTPRQYFPRSQDTLPPGTQQRDPRGFPLAPPTNTPPRPTDAPAVQPPRAEVPGVRPLPADLFPAVPGQRLPEYPVNPPAGQPRPGEYPATQPGAVPRPYSAIPSGLQPRPTDVRPNPTGTTTGTGTRLSNIIDNLSKMP